MSDGEKQENLNTNKQALPEIIYNPEKDFYKGVGGKLRLKAEGLFKKAKEKGISIERIRLSTLKENHADFPGIGVVELPAYMVKVRGRDIESNRVMVDGKQIDYYNRYQKYIAEIIGKKNIKKDRRENKNTENKTSQTKHDEQLFLSEWERFEIGKSLVDDKEFGMEKTITGACDRVIRKLMGENDWLYPDEARMLDEEFNYVQKLIEDEEKRRNVSPTFHKKATQRQINYLKARIKNLGMDCDDERVLRELVRQSGFGNVGISDLSTVNMSKIIDSINHIIPKVKEEMEKQGHMSADIGGGQLN